MFDEWWSKQRYNKSICAWRPYIQQLFLYRCLGISETRPNLLPTSFELISASKRSASSSNLTNGLLKMTVKLTMGEYLGPVKEEAGTGASSNGFAKDIVDLKIALEGLQSSA